MFDLDSALGVGISRNQLTFCTVSKGLQGFTLRSAYVIENFSELDPSELHSRVQQFTNSNGFNRENVIVGMPREQVIVHSIELPLEVEENLDQVVQFQAAKLDPAEEESSYFDYVVLERNEAERSLLLQIIMVPKATLDRTLQLFRELSLYPVAVRFSSLGLQQIFKVHEHGFGNEPSLVLDLSGDGLEIVLANGSQQCLPHKRELTSPDELTIDLILVELDAFISRLPVQLEGCRRIYLSGSRAEEFLEPMAERFGETEILGRKLKLKTAQKVKPELVHALGLAVSGLNRSNYSRFNLIPEAKRLVGNRASLVPTMALTGLFALLLILWGMRGFFQQQRLLDALTTELEQFQPRVAAALETRKEWEESSQEAMELHTMLADRQKVLEILKELTEKIPEDAYLQNLIVQKDKVTLTGYSQNDASSLLTLLGNSSLIANAESRYITEDRTTGNQKFNFELTLQGAAESLP